MLVIAIRIRK